MPKPTLEQAESTREQAKADVDSSTDALRVLGIADPESMGAKPPSAEIPLLAPRAGEVVELAVLARTNCCRRRQRSASRCSDMSSRSGFWRTSTKTDIASVHVGDAVTVDNETYPGAIRGKIQYLAPSLDPTTRTLQARIDAPNPGERLKKDMYVNIEVRAGTVPNALTVPDASVLRDDQNNPYVYIQAGNNQFARRDVTLAQSQDGKTQVLTGLHAGDHVVGNGSLFLQFQNSLQR